MENNLKNKNRYAILSLYKIIKKSKKRKERDKQMIKNKENTRRKKEKQIVKVHNKGITLIALVITIIVLLILAGVTIATLAGENGILPNATAAREETRYATIKEEKDLWELNKLTDEQTGSGTAESREEVINRLYDNGTITKEERDTLLAGDAITVANKPISFSATLVEMFKQAQKDNCTDTNCGNQNHLHIGDYLNYTPSDSSATTGGLTEQETGYTDEEQKYTVNTSTKWRVLGLNEAGDQILLTTESPIQKDGDNPYLILKGAESYMSCVNTLKKICNIYANTDLATEARSMTIDDINHALGVAVNEEENYMYKIGEESTPLEDYTGYFGEEYTYKVGNYAPENYMNDTHHTSYEEKKVGDSVDGNAYYYSYDIVDTSTTNPTLYELLFDGTTSGDSYAKSYWLASPGVGADSSYAYFGPGVVGDGYVFSRYHLFDSNGYWNAFWVAVRPVVSLKSTVTLPEIGGKGSASTTDIWAGKENNNPQVDSGYLSDDGLVSAAE